MVGALQNPAVPLPEQPPSTPPIPTNATLEQPVRTDQDPTEAQWMTNEPSMISPRCLADNRTIQQSVEIPASDPGEDANDMLATIHALSEITNSPALIQSHANRKNSRVLLKKTLPSSAENSLARNRPKRHKKKKK